MVKKTIRRALALSVMFCLASAATHEATAQKVTQTVRVYDATLIFPPPTWVVSQDDVVNGSEVYQHQEGNSFLLEFIRKHETFETWTEMLKITAYQTPKAQRTSVQQAIDFANAGYIEGCGHDNVGQHVFSEEKAGAIFGVFCGNTPNGPTAIGYGDGVGEISVNRLFIVKNTLIVVQYAWRRAKFDPANQATYPVPTPTIMHAVELLGTAQAVAN